MTGSGGQRNTAGILLGALLAALTAGAIFWARAVDTNLRGLRDDLNTLNKDLGVKLDRIIEFRGATRIHLESHGKRLDRLEHAARRR